MTDIVINKSISGKMKREAIRVYPNEACGLILKVNGRLKFFACDNDAPNPKETFCITAKQFAEAEDIGEVVAIWHSHVDEPANPSSYDVQQCDISGFPWFISAVYKNRDGNLICEELFSLTPKETEFSYYGRPYIYGLQDCFTLMTDYYKREFDIDVTFRAKGYPETEDWFKNNDDIIVGNIEKAGFVKLINQEPVVGDIFLIKMNSQITNHIAIFIGDNRILHHCKNRLSSSDVYGGGYFQKHTTHHLRWRDFCEEVK